MCNPPHIPRPKYGGSPEEYSCPSVIRSIEEGGVRGRHLNIRPVQMVYRASRLEGLFIVLPINSHIRKGLDVVWTPSCHYGPTHLLVLRFIIVERLRLRLMLLIASASFAGVIITLTTTTIIRANITIIPAVLAVAVAGAGVVVVVEVGTVLGVGLHEYQRLSGSRGHPTTTAVRRCGSVELWLQPLE